MHLTSFSMGIVVTALMIAKGMFELMLYVLIGAIVILLAAFAYNYIRGIDHMQENHPDYKGEDLFDEGETESKL